MSIMEGWKNVPCSIRIWASGIERERERNCLKSNDFNINQKFLSLRFLFHFLSFNKMYIHIFPIKLL